MADPDIMEKAASIRLAVFDIDGVMTRGDLLFGPDGSEYKMFHVHDGLGLVMLRTAGITTAVISSRDSPAVSKRFEALGISHVIQGSGDKSSALRTLMKELELERSAIAYTGDDLVDLPAMQHAGLAIAVANATAPVREQADWVTTARGGEGAVREVCELILNAQGLLESMVSQFLSP